MNLLTHNLKMAFRNLNKYKLQTLISIVSIAIGIVTIAAVDVFTKPFRLPEVCKLPYYDRMYTLRFDSLYSENAPVLDGNSADIQNGPRDIEVSREMIQALKGNGGMSCVDNLCVANYNFTIPEIRFLDDDSLVAITTLKSMVVDSEYLVYMGVRSAITGGAIKVPKSGEAVISEREAKRLFGDRNPVGLTVTEEDKSATIVDVVADNSSINILTSTLHACVCYCLGNMEDVFDRNSYWFYSRRIGVVLKEGLTTRQLEDEVNMRLKPLGVKTHVQSLKESMEPNIRPMLVAVSIILLCSSLILLASFLGFIRMQIQLFWMRKRELSLRIVTGGKKMQLFSMLLTEVLLVVVAAVVVAMLAGILLEDFLNTCMPLLQENEFINIDGVCEECAIIGGVLVAICVCVVWLTLQRICKANGGLASAMRNSRTHLFRNTMLCIQITVCMMFVCGMLIAVHWVGKTADAYNIPADEETYKNTVLIVPRACNDSERLQKTLKQLPEVGEYMCYDEIYRSVDVFEINAESGERYVDETHYMTLVSTDTAIIDFFHLKKQWFNGAREQGRYVLVREDYYGELKERRLSKDIAFRLGNPEKSFRIAGIFSGSKPFCLLSNSFKIIVIDPECVSIGSHLLLRPKVGDYKSLVEAVNATVEEIEPAAAERFAYSYYEWESQEFRMFGIIETGVLILGIASLIICAMNIYSTVALDTRTRKKEVAIRKVNGAKVKDIMRMFCRLYVVLCIVAACVSIPVSYMLDYFLTGLLRDFIPSEEVGSQVLAATMLIVLGIGIVIALIFSIVSWYIRKMCRVNPAEEIAKE